MGFEETLDVRLLLPWVGSSEPPVIRVWTGGPARIRTGDRQVSLAVVMSLPLFQSVDVKPG